ncbi:zinc-ribbon domain-containing protein [uncultured Methanobrevibacter sp.]|uniref:zinc-ribbon domain-containing protein n=1 Tax=uncultured Methanobrevibacter sp. TaxID=253161 RepID=UPI0025D6F764|nr:zinc-ribbon domain-containing protein [uncultured Methanobrevibacter sp.]
MVKFCHNCGAELRNENDKFCQKCGAEVYHDNNSNFNNLDSGMTCPNCGEMVPLYQKSCPHCGQVFEDNTVAVIIGYVVSIVFSIFGLIPGAYLLTRDNPKSRTQGVIVCAVSVLNLSALFIRWFAYLFMIIAIGFGIYLWINDEYLL